MKRECLPGLTPEQAADELVLMEFEKLLKAAKRKAKAAQLAEDEVFKALQDMCIEPDEIPSEAENADNLQDAITCYLSYDEYSLKGIMHEVRNAYSKEGA